MTPEPNTRRARRTVSIEGPDPIDSHVGRRMRLRRAVLGKSQDQVARALGVSFQQVQKYERGSNRISASRLFDVARCLDVPVGYFFDDLADDAVAARDQEVKVAFANDLVPEAGDDPMTRTETLDLIDAYYRRPPGERVHVLALLRALGSGRYAPADQAAE
ncbi:helix-turn-helix domain-containing protein [Roseospira visakhapatnamensis]|uniref:Transcriptional regulator with XRE-family HTH domain n=1 Tax=Roseospira visakhapatnamensis TaxID=390880 RepID=A0A7W6WBU2_9PROT|nr:helix-turn-helix transcriptional regulator [Roseospira visakhapatnamensis]MBB4268188.1 transcriptional regulator with XRE-family HTH domain [Roseospira visakhapatnamensis]